LINRNLTESVAASRSTVVKIEITLVHPGGCQAG